MHERRKRQRRYLTVCNYLQEECREDRGTLLRGERQEAQTQVRAREILIQYEGKICFTMIVDKHWKRSQERLLDLYS